MPADAPRLAPIPPALRRRLWVGFSGGLDSTVLLHLAAADDRLRQAGLRAIHIHHGLAPEAEAWATHCRDVCISLGIALDVVRVRVDPAGGLGPEAAARQARYSAFAAVLSAGETLALAHHREDQAETFLLRALRGSGVDGLAAMRPWRQFRQGFLWRPLLDTPRAALLAWAQTRGLRWIEDASNADGRFDRNFLRHRVLPLLRERWPQTSSAFAQSAHHCGQARDLLDKDDPALLAQVQGATAAQLDCVRLRALEPEQQARVLRLWVRGLGLPPLPEGGVRRVLGEVVAGAPDRQPEYAWRGARLVRWLDQLHAAVKPAPLPGDWSCAWDGSAPLELPGGSRLALEGRERFPAPVQVRARRGGERVRLPQRRHSSSLKHLLQEQHIPPWERQRLPLLFAADGSLLAAGDVVISGQLQHQLTDPTGPPGRLVWTRDAAASPAPGTHPPALA